MTSLDKAIERAEREHHIEQNKLRMIEKERDRILKLWSDQDVKAHRARGEVNRLKKEAGNG